MFLNPSNQLIQIDTGSALTYLYNPSQGLGAIAAYKGLGENQVLGQRYFGYAAGALGGITATNPSGSPAVYILCQYLSTSATTLANWTTAGAPAPVYWTDQTYTTVSGVKTEGWTASSSNFNDLAGYWMPNTVSLPNATLAQLLGGWGLVQVMGPIFGAYGPTLGTAGVGNPITGGAGVFQSTGVVAATGTAYATFGLQVTAISSGLCNVFVNSDIY
jgi:hypothetical protein